MSVKNTAFYQFWRWSYLSSVLIVFNLLLRAGVKLILFLCMILRLIWLNASRVSELDCLNDCCQLLDALLPTLRLIYSCRLIQPSMFMGLTCFGEGTCDRMRTRGKAWDSVRIELSLAGETVNWRVSIIINLNSFESLCSLLAYWSMTRTQFGT